MKKYWKYVALVIVLIIALRTITKTTAGTITIESAEGEISYLDIIDDLYPLKGIDFAQLTTFDTETTDYETKHTIDVLSKFYENYTQEIGKKLIKVYYIDQIIRRTGIRDLYFTRITFHSRDGKEQTIQPEGQFDNIILLTLEKHRKTFSINLIMPEDNTPQRWIKNIERIVIE